MASVNDAIVHVLASHNKQKAVETLNETYGKEDNSIGWISISDIGSNTYNPH